MPILFFNLRNFHYTIQAAGSILMIPLQTQVIHIEVNKLDFINVNEH